jgi:hypothetical protein
MRDVIIQGALSGLVFFAIGSWYYKAQQKSLKKKITKKISSGDFSKEDILAMINYHTNTDDEKIEGLRYISIAEKKFSKDKEIDEGIFSYYLNTLNGKADCDSQVNFNPNNSSVTSYGNEIEHKILVSTRTKSSWVTSNHSGIAGIMKQHVLTW